MSQASINAGLCISCSGHASSTGVWFSHIMDMVNGIHNHNDDWTPEQKLYLDNQQKNITETLQQVFMEVGYAIRILEAKVDQAKNEIAIVDAQSAEDAPTLKKVLSKLSDVMAFMYSSEAKQTFTEWTLNKDTRLKELSDLVDLKEEQILLMVERVDNDFSKNFKSIQDKEDKFKANMQKSFDMFKAFMNQEMSRTINAYQTLHAGIINEHACVICKQFVDENLKPISQLRSEQESFDAMEKIEMKKHGK